MVNDIIVDDDPAPNRVVEKAIDELSTQTVVFDSVEATSENGGTVSVSGGVITYRPRANFYGTDAIFYVIRDQGPANSLPDNWVAGSGGTFTQQPVSLTTRGRITLTVNPVNDPPTASTREFFTLEDTTLNVAGLLGAINASPGPLEFDPLILSVVSTPTANGGTVTLTPVGNDYQLTYVPAPNFFGSDTFDLNLTDVPPAGPSPQMDARSAVPPIRLTVTVRPVNDAPVTTNETVHVLEDTAADITPLMVVANDRVDPFTNGSSAREDRTDAGNVAQTAVSIVSAVSGTSNPAGTSVTVTSNGTIRVTPPTNYYTQVRTANGGSVRVAPALHRLSGQRRWCQLRGIAGRFRQLHPRQ